MELTLILGDGVVELRDGVGDLNTGLEESTLTLEADVKGPFDEVGHVLDLVGNLALLKTEDVVNTLLPLSLGELGRSSRSSRLSIALLGSSGGLRANLSRCSRLRGLLDGIIGRVRQKSNQYNEMTKDCEWLCVKWKSKQNCTKEIAKIKDNDIDG